MSIDNLQSDIENILNDIFINSVDNQIYEEDIDEIYENIFSILEVIYIDCDKERCKDLYYNTIFKYIDIYNIKLLNYKPINISTQSEQYSSENIKIIDNIDGDLLNLLDNIDFECDFNNEFNIELNNVNSVENNQSSVENNQSSVENQIINKQNTITNNENLSIIDNCRTSVINSKLCLKSLLNEFNTDDINFIENIKNNLNISDELIEKYRGQFYKLLKINDCLPEQRSREWYEFRNNNLTASVLEKIFNATESSLNQVIIDKLNINKNNYKPGKACIHGIKYEEPACMIYESRFNTKIKEFGCIPHPIIPQFAASPDGICDDTNKNLIGRMIEIKCPYSRIITGKPKPIYWVQMQGQMEVADLDYCDFVECTITEYENEEKYYMDGDDIKTNNNLEKGILINAFDNIADKDKYFYCPLNFNKIDKVKWTDTQINNILNSNSNLDYKRTIWWKLDKISCITIKRNKEWFENNKHKIGDFWKKVDYYKNNPDKIKDILPKKKLVKIIHTDDKCLISDD